MKYKLCLLLIIAAAIFLRVYRLGNNPPSLNWDEASLGYNAFSILTTGYDEHGEKLPIARFIAFGDYKPPGYIYMIVPFMAIFGVNEFSIRFPSALAGIIMVILTYCLTIKLTKNQLTGIIASAFISISPWSLQLSRAAYEANLASVFNLLGIFFWLSAGKHKWQYLISFIFFTLSFYTFNANRILAPLFIILLSLIYFKQVITAKKWIIAGIIISLIILLPSVNYLKSRESRLRFDEVSIFTNLDIIKKSNNRIERLNGVWWSKILNNRRIYYAREFLIHYADNFKAEFLFISGDRNPRLSIQTIGELYLFELPFLLTGIFYVLKNRNQMSLLLFGWLLIAPIPASVARETPHMLRTASILPVYQIFSGIGFVAIWEKIKKIKIFIKIGYIVGFIMIVGFSLFYYLHNYWVHYPLDWSGEWQYGYKQLVEKIQSREANFDRINLAYNFGRPYIYFLLYEKINPINYVKIRQASRDWYGFWTVSRFGKYDFVGLPKIAGEKVLGVGKSGTFLGTDKLDEIKAPDGKVILELGIL